MRRFSTLPLALLAVGASATAPSRKQPCQAEHFIYPDIDSTEILEVTAAQVHNFTRTSTQPGSIDGESYTISFCNVTVTYTHPGWQDQINVNVWLPLSGWNERLWALGGGGYSASFGSLYLTQAVARGFAAIATDSGHEAGLESSQYLEWALSSPENLNLALIEDWGSRTLEELAVIGKDIARQYYDHVPSYSYFSGCSGGGRQAMMIAQRYPDQFDGILAVAPAISIETFIPAAYWATQVMNDLGVYPSPCEIDAFTERAVRSCDAKDGFRDGIVAMPGRCNFSAASVVGETFMCNGTAHNFSAAAAAVVQAAWDGPGNRTTGISWPGLNIGVSLSSTYLATSQSDELNGEAATAPLLSSWFKYMLAKDPAFDPGSMTTQQFYDYLELSRKTFRCSVAADDPDLSGFRRAGGKMIAWHGMADEVIPTRQSEAYYDEVLKLNQAAHDFFRYFEAPGVGHCAGGAGPMPTAAFEQLMSWVENGTAPATLQAHSGDVSRPLCPYPLAQTFTGNATDGEPTFACLPQTGTTPGVRRQ